MTRTSITHWMGAALLAATTAACSDRADRTASETARATGEAADKAAGAIAEAGKDAARVAKDATGAVGEAVANGGRAADAAVETMDVKVALAADSRIEAGDINVDTDHLTRTVTLKGRVPTSAQKTIAEQIAATKAVGYRVVNELVVGK